jgi:hypothetical protein
MATARTPGQLPMPRAIREGGRRGWMTAAAGGAVLGAVTLVVPSLLPPTDAFGFLAVWLGVTAAVYLGFALQDGRTRAVATPGGGAPADRPHRPAHGRADGPAAGRNQR